MSSEKYFVTTAKYVHKEQLDVKLDGTMCSETVFSLKPEV